MRKTFKRLFNVAGAVDLFVTYGWPTMGAAMTAVLGYMEAFPLMSIWLSGLGAFALIVWTRHWLYTPTGRDREKRDAFYSVCSETFRITENFDGSKDSFFAALNRARVSFSDDEDVQKVFARLRNQPGNDGVIIPELIQEMGRVVKIKVDRDHFGTAYSPTRSQAPVN